MADNATRWLPPPALSNDQRRELAGVLERGRLANAAADPKITATLLVQLSHVVLIRDCADHDAMMRVYVEDLTEIPPDLMQGACVTWRRASKFWPTIAELRALIVPDLSRRRRYLERALVLASVAENPAPDGAVSDAWLRDRRTAARTPCARFSCRLPDLPGGGTFDRGMFPHHHHERTKRWHETETTSGA